MIIIPGFLISLATFPGVIVHEAAHMFFCKLRHVAVFNMCFFRIGNPAGYIIHEDISNFTDGVLGLRGTAIDQFAALRGHLFSRFHAGSRIPYRASLVVLPAVAGGIDRNARLSIHA